MRFILLLLLPILFDLSGKAQPKVFQDSLAQFSYLLFGSTVLNKESNSTKVQGRQGTGFFIKKHKRIYFVTARHAVTNHVIDGEKRNDFPENYNVYSHYSDPFNFIPVPAEWFPGNSKIKDALNTSDVFTYDVTDHLNSMPISYIDLPGNLKPFKASKSGYGEIRFFGFPEKMNRVENGIIQISPPYLFTSKNFSLTQNFLNQIGNEIGIDSFRYEIQIKDSKVSSGLAGFSGSPVFIQTDQTNKWEFLGIAVAINPIRNSIYVVKREIILMQILNL